MQGIRFACAALAGAALAAPAGAQESSYAPSTVWELTQVRVEPGQFERYMDFLAKEFRRSNEFGKKEGYVVSYHVFQVNAPRQGEPDLILAVEYKDYVPNAERMAAQKRYEAFVASDTRKLETESGERKAMRTLQGNMELQELKFK